MELRRLAPLALVLALPAQAADFNAVGNLTQGEFRRLAEDLGAATSYKGVTPATPLGIAGFDVGLEVSATDVKNSGVFNAAGAGSPSTLYLPKVHVHKGLFGRLDLGAFVGALSDVGGTVAGASLRWAVLDDGLATPALGLRLSGTKTLDLGPLDVNTIAADLVVSKRLTIVTPYGGFGTVRTTARASGTALSEERASQGRGFAGLNVNLGLLNLAFEAEKMGGNTTLSAKAGWRF